MTTLTIPARCVRAGCRGMYGPIDLDGAPVCLVCGRSPHVETTLCEIRECPTCGHRARMGLDHLPAVGECRHSGELPHCEYACATLPVFTGGPCRARKCAPCQNARAQGRESAPAVACRHLAWTVRVAEHCVIHCDLLRRQNIAAQLRHFSLRGQWGRRE